MNLIIQTKELELTDEIKNLISEKIETPLQPFLKRLAPDLQNVHLRLKEKPDWGYTTSFDMWLPGKRHIFAISHHEDLISAFSQLREEVELQLKEYLGR